MTGIVLTPAAPVVPIYPALGSANFNQEAYAYGSSMPAVSYRIWEIGKAAEANATYIAQLVQSAGQSEANALTYANQANGYKQAAAQSEANALAYAQATGNSAGIPPPVSSSIFQSNAVGGVFWGPMPKDASKLDKQGGVATALGYSYNDLGTIAAAGTAAVNVQTAAVQRIQAGGNITLTIAGWAIDGRSEDLELHCVNFGGKTITWPAGNWIKSDGSFASSVGLAGVTWQTAGTDRVLVMRDAGVLYFKVMR